MTRARPIRKDPHLVRICFVCLGNILAPSEEARAKVRLLREFEPGGEGGDVPDPYYGGADGFEHVLDLCEAACRGLLAHVRRERT